MVSPRKKACVVQIRSMSKGTHTTTDGFEQINAGMQAIAALHRCIVSVL